MQSSNKPLNVSLRIATESELEQFKNDLQKTFRASAEKEFGHMLDEPIPSDSDIEESFQTNGAIVYLVELGNKTVGGAVVSIDNKLQHNKLLLFFINTNYHDRGIGYKAWKAIEKKHPKTKVWETVTPYFEKRNIHFYINKCGFRIVEYYNKLHPDPNQLSDNNTDEEDNMFRLEKNIE